jgi:hypothetical protein
MDLLELSQTVTLISCSALWKTFAPQMSPLEGDLTEDPILLAFLLLRVLCFGSRSPVGALRAQMDVTK